MKDRENFAQEHKVSQDLDQTGTLHRCSRKKWLCFLDPMKKMKTSPVARKMKAHKRDLRLFINLRMV